MIYHQTAELRRPRGVKGTPLPASQSPHQERVEQSSRLWSNRACASNLDSSFFSWWLLGV